MTAILLSPLFEQFADANGNPLVGGLIYSYLAGTLTPQNTYTDATGTIPAANPIVLNSAGRPVGGVWGSGVYKFILKDSLGNTIDTVDNVTAIYGAGDMTKAVYDAANVAQQLLGTTAVQTVQNKTLDNTNSFGGTIASGATINGTIAGSPAFSGYPAFSAEDKASGGLTKTSDTAFANIPGMTWTLVPGTYSLRTWVLISQAAAGGNKLQFTSSGTATINGFVKAISNGATSFIYATYINAFSVPTNSTTGTVNYTEMDMQINVTVTSTITLQGAQQASNVTSTSFFIASGHVRPLS